VEERFGEADLCFTGRLWSIKEDFMRRTSLAVVIAIATITVFSMLLVPLVGANSAAAPLLQTTGTAVGTTTAATAAATTAATTTAATAAATTAATTTAATAAATTAATTTAATAAATTTTGAATPTRAPGTLPNTSGDAGSSALLLGAAALVLIGVAAALLLGRRRDTTA
jgi:LPXTG-motif cell wall-anchored protein